MARPMPREPPVTTAFLPLRSSAMGSTVLTERAGGRRPTARGPFTGRRRRYLSLVSTEPARRPRRPIATTVRRAEWLSPTFVRIVLGGGDLERFGGAAFADAYVKVVFLHPDGDYARPVDMDAIRATMPREYWPRLRTYTVRAWDPDRLELTLDFVVHGDEGLAGPWARRARPGDEVLFMGPGGAYSPDPAADWHLLIGDESALPAIAAAAERLPDSATARLFIEVAGPDDELPLKLPAGAELTWLHRGSEPVGARLVEAVTGS